MPLFETIPVDHKLVGELLLKHWNLNLGKLLKASQNHTFQAFSIDNQKKYSVRVTPDPKKLHLQRIQDQIAFVTYLVTAELKHQVSPIKTITHPKTFIHNQEDLIIVVFEWAKGSALNFVELRWMKDEAVIFAWGRYFAQLHKLSMKFQTEKPEIAKRIQKWDEAIFSLLSGIELHPDDIALVDNPQHFGVIHGDLNPSNMHYVEQKGHLSVFDTDLLQRGFYLLDMAQAIFTLVLLEEGGMPYSKTPVEGCNRKAFQDVIVAGYESQGLKVDLDRLDRMVEIRRQFLIRFADRAFKQENVPKDIQALFRYIQETIGSKKAVNQ